jgi:glycosyltransferase involved in cell wall biosynthesis
MQLSVVVPNFNHAHCIGRALRALLRQSPPPDEIIIVDDASTDDSLRVIQGWQRERPSIRLLRHPVNRGAPAALNTGLAVAAGEFVYFAAADDFALDGFFAAAIAALKEHPQAAYVCGRIVVVGSDGRIVDFRPLMAPAATDAFISPHQAVRIARSIDNWAVGPSVVFRRSTLVEIGGFDESLGPLCDGMIYRLLAFRHGFCFSDRLVAAWETRPDNLSKRPALSATEGLQMIANAKRAIARTFPPPLNREYADLFTRRLTFNLARLALASGASAQTVADLAGFNALERRAISLLASARGVAHPLLLSWLMMRLRPFGALALARGWLDRLTHNRNRRNTALRLVSQATET